MLSPQNESTSPQVDPPVGARDWPVSDYSRVPYGVFTQKENYEHERRAIFRGPVWNYLALEAEIPNPGDFVTSYVGDIQVVVNRRPDRAITAFVNT
jgi:anthranilate 1,2-dioxygenase large subunit